MTNNIIPFPPKKRESMDQKIKKIRNSLDRINKLMLELRENSATGTTKQERDSGKES